nr:uncharacterized protein LOC112290527 [Physcomitrium patens]|eukprot:XP_024392686.1 uncharacterized protein LOC112290527 [Physcomitrella patens]
MQLFLPPILCSTTPTPPVTGLMTWRSPCSSFCHCAFLFTFAALIATSAAAFAPESCCCRSSRALGGPQGMFIGGEQLGGDSLLKLAALAVSPETNRRLLKYNNILSGVALTSRYSCPSCSLSRVYVRLNSVLNLTEIPLAESLQSNPSWTTACFGGGGGRNLHFLSFLFLKIPEMP